MNAASIMYATWVVHVPISLVRNQQANAIAVPLTILKKIYNDSLSTLVFQSPCLCEIYVVADVWC